MKVEFSRQTFEKYWYFTTVRSVGVKLFHGDGRTDGRTNSRFLAILWKRLRKGSRAEKIVQFFSWQYNNFQVCFMWKKEMRLIYEEFLTIVILDKWPKWRKVLFYVFIFIYNCLHVSSTSCSSPGETNFINTASGSCWWPCRVQVGS